MASKRKRGGRPKGRTFGEALHMRVDGDTLARLDALAEQIAPTGLGRSAVARLALIFGLAAAEVDVRVLLGAEPRKKR